MNKKNIFLFIIGIAIFVIVIIFINILINRYEAGVGVGQVLQPLPQVTKQGLITGVMVEKEEVLAPQDEPEIEPGIKPGEQLLH